MKKEKKSKSYVDMTNMVHFDPTKIDDLRQSLKTSLIILVAGMLLIVVAAVIGYLITLLFTS